MAPVMGASEDIRNGPSPGRIKETMSQPERLFHYTYADSLKEPHFLEFRLLQRLNLVQIQNELAIKKGQILTQNAVASDDEMKQLRTLLHEYTNAIRDFEYLQTLGDITGPQVKERRADLTHAFPEIAYLTGDPYNSRYRCLKDPSVPSVDPLRRVLQRLLPRDLTYTKEEKRTRIDDYLAGYPPHGISPFVDSLSRFFIAFIGGAAVVVPMVIMTLHKSVNKSLITVSVAVLLVGAALSLGIKASNMETLVATATYAAVLVVFVGSNSS